MSVHVSHDGLRVVDNNSSLIVGDPQGVLGHNSGLGQSIYLI